MVRLHKKMKKWNMKQLICLQIKEMHYLVNKMLLIIGTKKNYKKSLILIIKSIKINKRPIRFANSLLKLLKNEFMVGCGCVQMDINVNLDIVYHRVMYLKQKKNLLKKKDQLKMRWLMELIMKEISWFKKN